MSTAEVTPENDVSACFTQPALTNVALGNSCYLTAFLETISPGYPDLKMGTKMGTADTVKALRQNGAVRCN